MTKIAKILMGFGVFLGFCASILPYKTHADATIELFENHVSVLVEDYLQLTVVSNTGNSTLGVSYDDDTHTYSGTMLNGSNVSDFGTTVFSATTNNSRGWTLTASSETKDAADYSTLVGTATGIAISSSTATLSGSSSSWNIGVTPYSNSSDITPATIASGFASGPHIVPSSPTAIASGAVGSKGGVTVKYGIGISSTQPADTYVGAVNYILSINSGS